MWLTALMESVQLAKDASAQILGYTKQQIKPLRRTRSNAEAKIVRRMRLLKVAWKDINDRIDGRRHAPSTAMKKLWDANIKPMEPQQESVLRQLSKPEFKQWALEWIEVIRCSMKSEQALLEGVQGDIMKERLQKYRDTAQERMGKPGSKEIKRWLGETGDRPSMLYMESQYPSIVVLTGITEPPINVRYQLLEFIVGTDITTRTDHSDYYIENIPMNRIYSILKICEGLQCTLKGVESRLVEQASDKLTTWEFFLGNEAQATKAVCATEGCLGRRFWPIVEISESQRVVHSWCASCASFVKMEVRSNDYVVNDEWIAQKLSPQVQLTPRLRRPITREDLLERIKELPNNKAPGPDELSNEMLKEAPEVLIEILLEALNTALTSDTPLPEIFKHGFVHLLFKKGDPTKHSNWRPIVLLSTVYKLLTSIITYRLAELAEDHGLLDPNQEGFRRHRSTLRQAQALAWDHEDARLKKSAIYSAYIDFKMAFNSMDQEAMWKWLEALGLHSADVMLLRNLYKETYNQVKTTFGITGPIFLQRGTKQGDCLSSLLFLLIFNALLSQLEKLKVGYKSDEDRLTLYRAFADDLQIQTSSRNSMQRAFDTISDFCEWSGMRTNPEKTEICAYHHGSRRQLNTDTLRLQGSTITAVNPFNPITYLGIRKTLVGDHHAQKLYVVQKTRGLRNPCINHPYTLQQATEAISMIQEAWFRYSAALVPWSMTELDLMDQLWRFNFKKAAKLSEGTATCILNFPSIHGGRTIKQAATVYLQALCTHIAQLLEHADYIREHIQANWTKLVIELGSNLPGELGEILSQEARPRTCPLARLLRLACELQIHIELPTLLTGPQTEYRTWAATKKDILQTAIDDNITLAEDQKTFLRLWETKTAKLREDGLYNVKDIPVEWAGQRVPAFRRLTERECRILATLLPLDKQRKRSNLDKPKFAPGGLLDFFPAQTIQIPLAEEKLPMKLVPDILDFILEMCKSSSMNREKLRKTARRCVNHDIPDMLFGIMAETEEQSCTAKQVKRRLRQHFNADTPDVGSIRLYVDKLRAAHDHACSQCMAQYQDELDSKIAELNDEEFEPVRIVGAETEVIHDQQNGRLIQQKKYIVHFEIKSRIGKTYISNSYHNSAISIPDIVTAENDWGNPDIRGRLIAEYDQLRQATLADIRTKWKEMYTPAYPQLPQIEKKRPTLTRKIRIVLTTPEEHTNSVGDVMYKCNRGIATVYSTQLQRQEILKANQARVGRLFGEHHGDSNRWRQWKMQAEEQDKAGLALSMQSLHQLREMLDLNAIVGIHPLLAPSSYPIVWNNMRDKIGWGADMTVRGLLCVIPKTCAIRQCRSLLQDLKQICNTSWVIMLQCGNDTAAIRTYLRQQGQCVRTFSKEETILHERDAWRRATSKTRQADCRWELWTPAGYSAIDMENLYVTRAGVPREIYIPDEDFMYGANSVYYSSGKEIIACDGSVKKDGSMGAAAIVMPSYEASPLEPKLSCLIGPINSTVAELRGLALAEEYLKEEHSAVILTDSLASLQALQKRQREDFQYFKERESIRESLDWLVDALNKKAEAVSKNGGTITIAKVIGHTGDPMNEAADAHADVATNLAPDTYFHLHSHECKISITGDIFKPWSPHLGKAIIQHVAAIRMGTERTTSTYTEKWLRTKNAYREILGAVLIKHKVDSELRHVMQSISRSLPTQGWVHKFNKSVTPDCKLCKHEHESIGHIQCRCPKLKRPRIQVHHEIWTGIADAIRESSKIKGHTILTECTLPAITAAIQDYPKKTAAHQELLNGVSRLDETDLTVPVNTATADRNRNTHETNEAQSRQRIDNVARLENSVTQSIQQTESKGKRKCNPTRKFLRPTSSVQRRKIVRRQQQKQQITLEKMLDLQCLPVPTASKHRSLREIGAEVKIDKAQMEYLRRKGRRKADIQETVGVSPSLSATRLHLSQDRAGSVEETQTVERGDTSHTAVTIPPYHGSNNDGMEITRAQSGTNEIMVARLRCSNSSIEPGNRTEQRVYHDNDLEQQEIARATNKREVEQAGQTMSELVEDRVCRRRTDPMSELLEGGAIGRRSLLTAARRNRPPYLRQDDSREQLETQATPIPTEEVITQVMPTNNAKELLSQQPEWWKGFLIGEEVGRKEENRELNLQKNTITVIGETGSSRNKGMQKRNTVQRSEPSNDDNLLWLVPQSTEEDWTCMLDARIDVLMQRDMTETNGNAMVQSIDPNEDEEGRIDGRISVHLSQLAWQHSQSAKQQKDSNTDRGTNETRAAVGENEIQKEGTTWANREIEATTVRKNQKRSNTMLEESTKRLRYGEQKLRSSGKDPGTMEHGSETKQNSIGKGKASANNDPLKALARVAARRIRIEGINASERTNNPNNGMGVGGGGAERYRHDLETAITLDRRVELGEQLLLEPTTPTTYRLEEMKERAPPPPTSSDKSKMGKDIINMRGGPKEEEGWPVKRAAANAPSTSDSPNDTELWSRR